ncbi:MAG: FHA domain-containing protein [Myxococcota bacterium]
MDRIDGYILQLQRDGRERFLNTYPHPFLLIINPERDGDWTEFHTESVNTDMVTLAAEVSATESKAMGRTQDLRVLKIAKSFSSPWRGRISIGRARNTDVVLKDKSVSKLHAHFSTSDNGRVSITDAGSRNGTKVNGVELEPSMPVPLSPSNKIVLGRVHGVFHTAETFCDFIDKLLRR